MEGRRNVLLTAHGAGVTEEGMMGMAKETPVFSVALFSQSRPSSAPAPLPDEQSVREVAALPAERRP
jgi:phosphoglycerate dehydrogenase-like enzyme